MGRATGWLACDPHHPAPSRNWYRNRRAGAVNGSISGQVHRATPSRSARRASSRSFSATTTSAGCCPGRSSRPSFTIPSNSPTARRSGHAKSTRPTPSTTHCSTGGGSPRRHIATRLRDSPTLSARPSAKARTRAAAALPRRPGERDSAAASVAGVTASACRAASAMTTACSNGRQRAQSSTVRAAVVTAHPPTVSISSVASRAGWTCSSGSMRPPPRRSRETCTRPSPVHQDGHPCSAAAQTWLTTASGASPATAARTSRAWRAMGSSGGGSVL